MGILQLIASRNFITVNKELIKELGLDEAILLGELASEFDYWEKQNKLEDNYFYSTIENIEENTTLSEFKQRKALNKLKQLNLVDVKVKGIPAKRYIKINEEQVFELLKGKFLKNSGTGTEKIQELDSEKLKGNNNINNNNKINNNINNIELEFKEIWSMYPKKQGKTNALKSYIKARKKGTTKEEVWEGLGNYLEYIKQAKIQQQYIKQGSTWFNQECWQDDYTIPQKGARENGSNKGNDYSEYANLC